jgi:hypothetical protein
MFYNNKSHLGFNLFISSLGPGCANKTGDKRNRQGGEKRRNKNEMYRSHYL